MRTHLAAIAPETEHDVFAPVAQSLNDLEPSESVLRVGFAYATLSGVQRFISLLRAAGSWNDMGKEMVIGVHQAITEPAALELLRAGAQTSLRAFLPGGRLCLEAFDARPVFHPKMLSITSVRDERLQLLFAGSANLTSAAIGERPANFELAVTLAAEQDESLDTAHVIRDWWLNIWNASRPVDRRFIRQYATLRQQVLERNPILRATADIPAGIHNAPSLFAEVGAGSGPPDQRHQIEFPQALAAFFGDVQRGRRSLTLCRDGQEWQDRPFSYKTTTYGVEIWRLGMPTQNAGGFPIAERAILFTRSNQPNRFDFEVADVGSPEFLRWMAAANISGHLGATRGQRSRRFGFY